MAKTSTPKGRGWHGDPDGHARAGSKSSGNKQAAKNLSREARSKGGKMSSGNFKNDPLRAREAGRKSSRRKPVEQPTGESTDAAS
jgi:uncharacterized protein